MPLPKAPLTLRVLVLAVLVVFTVAGVILLIRYGLHRLGLKLRRRG